MYRDTIKGHQFLYQNANIFHRNIFKNNIIIADLENDRDQKKMLIDLNLAKELNTSPVKARYCTRTIKFMAIKVLQSHTYTYCHNLKPFLYVFL